MYNIYQNLRKVEKCKEDILLHKSEFRGFSVNKI